MATGKPATALRIVRRFAAAPERVFDAWIDPAVASRWLFTGPTSEHHATEMEARAGGRWTITDVRDGVTYTAIGEYVEVDRPRRLVFTFEMPQFSPNADRVTIEIEPDGTGCVLTLTQEGVDMAEELAQLPPGAIGDSERGWGSMLDGLAALLAAIEAGGGHGASG